MNSSSALAPFVELISTILTLYGYVVFAWIIVSLLTSFDMINRFNPIVKKITEVLSGLVEPVLRPIRKLIPPISGIDLSPIILFLGIRFINSAMWHWLV